MPLAPLAGGRGKSVPLQLEPPSKLAYARMGKRKISFDPPARFFALLVFRVMYVSLCGPHSFDTSTFAPTGEELLAPVFPFAAWVERYWYLFHQVGLFAVLV